MTCYGIELSFYGTKSVGNLHLIKVKKSHYSVTPANDSVIPGNEYPVLTYLYYANTTCAVLRLSYTNSSEHNTNLSCTCFRDFTGWALISTV